jgi:hypothetical protein
VTLLTFVLIGSASVVVALVYGRSLSEWRRKASKAIEDDFETIAADLRKRALEVKKRDDDLRKRQLEVNEGNEPKVFFKDANAEKWCERERPQQQVLNEQQRMLKQSVSPTITLGLKDVQNRLLQANLKGILSAASIRKAELQRKLDGAALRPVRRPSANAWT